MTRLTTWTGIAVTLTCLAFAAISPSSGGLLRFSLHGEPTTLDPQLITDSPGDTVRYLTGGVLLRVNRKTQQIEPELASGYRVSRDGKAITLELRPNLRFSDGTPFTPADVVFTMRRVTDPTLHAPNGEAFRTASGTAIATVTGPRNVEIRFPEVVAGVERLFDAVPIQSAQSPQKERAVLGPFQIAQYTPGVSLQLVRNPNYWKRDAQGRALPYLDGITLTFGRNRDLELQQFRKGELQMISGMDPELFDQWKKESPVSAFDGGLSLDGEQLWFNLVPGAPLPEYKKSWLQNAGFRRAISLAINRADLARIVYYNYAQPAAGPISQANTFWYKRALPAAAFDPQESARRLAALGFSRTGDALYDAGKHRVELSILTTGGNKARERMGTLIQQDLAKIGIKVNLVPLDIGSLLERFTRTFQFDAVLLGLTNVQLDPAEQINVWLSSAPNHAWNPNQKSPATPWEAEIDRLVRTASTTNDQTKRKVAFDRLQEILLRESPFLDLVYKHSLAAVAGKVGNAEPVALTPQTIWNREWIYLRTQGQ